MMQGQKTPSLAAQTEPWGSKNGASLLELGKDALAAVANCIEAPEVYRSHVEVYGLLDATLSQNAYSGRFAYMLCSLAPDCQFCSHWLKACQMQEKPPRGGVQEHVTGKVIVFNCSS